ncbi:DUF5320 domain-containing protein [Clostridiaceae bacterium 35-E11]
MARRDGTGPMGMGPMTGRGMGLCRSGKSRSGIKAGFGYGRGMGRCFFYGNAAMDAEVEKSMLQNERTVLEARLKDVEKRLDDFEQEKK